MAETAVTAPSAASAAPAVRLASVWLTTLALGEDGVQPGRDGLPAEPSGSWAFLTAQSAMLLAILFGEPFRPAQASAIGQALVRANFLAADVLGRSLRVLMLRLPELLTDYVACPVRELERRVAEVSGALANGYVHALRDRTLAEQESVMRAELDEQRIISERLLHEATHDPLTGLPNRVAIFTRLAAALDGGRGDSVGVCFVDLDGFKAVNDRYGHQAGDELLVTVSRRICETATAFGALAGRISGDEFIVVADASPGASRMIMMARAILGELSRPVALRIGRVSISACAGIAERATRSATSAEIVADADAALYRAKSRGPGRWAVAGPLGTLADRSLAGHPASTAAAVHFTGGITAQRRRLAAPAAPFPPCAEFARPSGWRASPPSAGPRLTTADSCLSWTGSACVSASWPSTDGDKASPLT